MKIHINTKSILTFAFVLHLYLLSTPSYAQNFNYGEVSIEELTEEHHAIEEEAEAAILYKRESQYFDYTNEYGFVTVRKYNYRIKIYNEDGYYLADKVIPLNVLKGEKDRVINFKARSYNLVQGSINIDELDESDLIIEEYSNFLELNKFIIPNVKKGSVIEYEYEVQSIFTFITPLFRAQDDIPVNKAVFKFSHPEYYKYRHSVYGSKKPLYFKDQTSSTITFKSSSTSRTRGYFANHQGSGVTTNIENLNFTVYIKQFEFNNLPSYVDEGYELGRDNYASAVHFETEEVFINTTGYQKKYCRSWTDVLEHYNNASYLIEELNKSRYFKDDYKALNIARKFELERLSVIDSFLRQRLTWNKNLGIFPQKGVKKAYQESSGNVCDLNMIAYSMLKSADLEVYPIMLSSNQNLIVTRPTVSGFDYFMVAVKIEDKFYLIDITEKNATYNYIPNRIYGVKGFRYDKNGAYSLIDLTNEDFGETFNIVNASFSNGDIPGIMKSRLKGSAHANWANTISETGIENIEKNFERDQNIEIDQFETKSEGLTSTVSFNFINENISDEIGGKTMINPLLFLKTIDDFILDKDRTKPLFLGAPEKYKFMINLKIPNEYSITSIPESVVLQLPDNMGMYKYKISKNNMGISVMVQFEVNKSLIHSKDFEVIREFSSLILAKEKESITLVKNPPQTNQGTE